MKRINKPFMQQVRRSRALRPIAGVMAAVCTLLWQAPPAAAFHQPERAKHWRTQTPNPEQRKEIALKRREAAQHAGQPAVRELSPQEMRSLRGRGLYRNEYLSGTLPWQRSFRDVNLCTGNLFKSFTDLQVSPARGEGLAWQRTYNSNGERIGPFGKGWTHAYDIRMEEAGDNEVPRTDFFGGKHTYHRDADGLYTSPPYLHDEMSSTYDVVAFDASPQVSSDTQKGLDGTVKHFIPGGTNADSTPSSERVCDTITDRHGNQTTLIYGLTITNGDGSTKKMLTGVTDPTGRALEITWSNLGTTGAPIYRITQVQGPFDGSNSPVYTVSYEYDGAFNLWKVHQDPSGLDRVTTYTYTLLGDGLGDFATGLLASVSDPLGHTISYAYCSQDSISGNPTPTQTAWVSEITEPTGLVWSINTGYGRIFPRSDEAFYAGVQCVPVSGQSVNIVISVDSHLRSIGERIGEMTTVTQPTQERTYDTQNNVVSTTRYFYDDIIGPFTDPDGRWEVAEVGYGAHGNVLSQSLQGVSNSTTTTTYYGGDKYFQKESVTDPNGHTTTLDYYDDQDSSAGNRGEVKWVRDARYGTTGKQFDYTYNQYGQKATETNLNDVETDYTYGTSGANLGNLTQVVQDPGTGHLNRTTQLTYDYAGRVSSSTDPKSQTSTFTYNGAGQPLVATLPDETVTYTYGTNGRTDSVTDGRGTTTIGYETGNDRVHSTADPVTGTLTYTYEPLGSRASMTLPGGGTWSYSYEYGKLVAAGEDLDKVLPHLSRMEDDQGRVMEFGYENHGAPRWAKTDITYQSGSEVSYLLTHYGYDRNTSPASTRNRLLQVKNTWNQPDPMTGQWQQTVLVQNDYTYDDNGNRLTNQISDSSGPLRTEAYGYDALNRLTSVDYDDGETQSYSFDPMGNRSSKSDTTTSTVTESYSYNAANMLTARGSNSYTNDDNGNTLTGGGRTNTWDGENRLTQCVDGSTTTAFTYGADGLRRQSVTGTDTTDYVLDGQSAVRSFLNSSVDKTYLTGPRGPEYERTGSYDPVWYLYDGLGSVLGTVDPAGNVVNTRKYDVYGAVRASSGGSGPKHKWVGALGHPSEDETGLVYMRARYYDPITGRFIKQDPAKQGSNWFTYARNNPINAADASGKDSISMAFGTLLFAVGIMVMAAAAGFGTGGVKQAWTEIEVAVETFQEIAGTMRQAIIDLVELALAGAAVNERELSAVEGFGKIAEAIRDTMRVAAETGALACIAPGAARAAAAMFGAYLTCQGALLWIE